MTDKPKSRKGFASWPPEKLREVARKGGAAVPAESRTFTKDREAAREAGRIGGLVKRQDRQPK